MRSPISSRMKMPRTSCSLGAALLAASVLMSQSAFAADMLLDPPMEAPEVETKEAGGWYLRGDINYMSREIDDIYYGVYADPGNRSFTTSEFEDTFGIRGGVGYQVNENFRVDATFGYKFKSAFEGSTSSGAFPCPARPALGLPNGQLVGTNCTSTDTTSMSSYSLLANAYVDLGNFSGITPYLGAGIGGSYVTFESLNNSFNCRVAAVGGTCTGLQTDITHPGEEGWRFAYALHAGLSYDVSHRAKIDIGYSYEAISGGRMFGWENGATNGTTNQLGPQGHDMGLSDHVFRAGIRYQIW